MPAGKENVPVTVIVLFLISLIVLSLNIFVIPENAGPEYNLDKIFYYTLNIIFWLSTPNLLSYIIKKVIWKSEFKSFIGTGMIGIIEDISIVLIYFISIGLLLIKLFSIQISAGLLLVYLILIIIAVYIRPKFLKLAKSGFIQSARPFKIGDWLSLRNPAGENFATGQVISFDAKSVQIKSENNTLLILPNHLLSNLVIENYNALRMESQFSILIKLSPAIVIDQAKRILTAAARQSLVNVSYKEECAPNVSIVTLDKDYTEYKVNFSFKPWSPNSPESMKDNLLYNINTHLMNAGISFDYLPGYNIIEHIELFKGLEKSELELLSAASKPVYLKSGSIIISEGNSGDSMFILKEGLLNVKIKAKEKEELKVGILTPGQFFGEMSLFTGEARSATVTADTDSVVIEITKESMRVILDKKPDLINKFGEIIAERQGSNLKMMDDYMNKKESFIQKFAAKIKYFFDL